MLYVTFVMHYGGDIPYFVPFHNALRSITEHYGSDDTTFLYLITHRINSNIDQFAQIFASAFTPNVCFFSYLFHENRSSTVQILFKLGVHYGSEEVFPPLKNPYFNYLKLFIS